ncbi:MAG: precorrin-2 C(20)-methyltransferase [Acidimicrobiia bacterium]
MSFGTCYGVGVGPGDPELITLRALRILRAVPVVAHFAKDGRAGNALTAARPHLHPDQREVRLVYPLTTEAPPPGVSYESLLMDFYDTSAKKIAEILDGGDDVAVLCEGDPFFYGSYMYLHHRLAAGGYETEVVPGVAAMLAGAAALGTPLACRDEVLTVLSGVLSADELERRLRDADAAVVMKLGRNLARVRRAVERAGLMDRALYVERVTMSAQRILPLAEVDPSTSPYFSMVLIPGVTAVTR